MIRLTFLTALLASTCQVGPFPTNTPPEPPDPISVDPVPDAPLAAAGASSCGAAIENSKRLGCPFEADDAGGWCATRSGQEVACMASPKTNSCLALRQCTEASK